MNGFPTPLHRASFLFLIGWTVLSIGWIVSPMCLLAQSQPGPKIKTDWPGFLGPNRDSKAVETEIVKNWSAGQLPVVWEMELGAGYGIGSIANGRLMQMDAVDDVCRIRCVEALTGKAIWEFKYPFSYEDTYGFDAGPRSSPLIDGDRCYFHGVEGMLHCLNAETGALIWKVDTAKQFGVVQNFFGVGSSPAIHGDHLIVMIGGSPAADQNEARLDQVGSNESAIVFFDKFTGKVVHQFGDDLASYSSIQFYREDDKKFGLAWLRDNLIGFDLESGRELWKFPYRSRKYESVNASTPVVKDNEILISESYGLGSIRLNVRDGKPTVVWKDGRVRNQSLATHWNTPVLHEGHIYACHGANLGNAELRCVDWQTGEVKWKQRGYARSSLLLVGDHFVMLDERGDLILFQASPEKFSLVTRYSDLKGQKLKLKSPCWSAPVLANGMLYVRGKDRLICLALKKEASESASE